MIYHDGYKITATLRYVASELFHFTVCFQQYREGYTEELQPKTLMYCKSSRVAIKSDVYDTSYLQSD